MPMMPMHEPDHRHHPVGEPGQELPAEGGPDDEGYDQEVEDVPDGLRGA